MSLTTSSRRPASSCRGVTSGDAIRGERMSQGTVYEFFWDPAKAKSNARKHNLTFDQAATVFLDALALTVYDELDSQDEERLVYTRLRCPRRNSWL